MAGNVKTNGTGGHRLPGMTSPPGRALNIALWTLQVLVALTFVAAGSAKLLGSPDMIALFGAVGVGQSLRYVTGSFTRALWALLLRTSRQTDPWAGLSLLIQMCVASTWATLPNSATSWPEHSHTRMMQAMASICRSSVIS